MLLFEIVQFHSFEVRIEAMVLREEFNPSCAAMSHEIDVVRVATKGDTHTLIHTHSHTHTSLTSNLDI